MMLRWPAALWPLVAALLCGATDTLRENTELKSILIIIVDDLRPQIRGYHPETLNFMRTPNLDRLISESTLFEHAYVQIAICSPSRNSFLTGRYPDRTRVWNFFDHFRNTTGQNWTTMPEFFKNNGYFATGAGKVFHPAHPPNWDEPLSWSEKWGGPFSKCDCVTNGTQDNPVAHATCEGLTPNQQCQESSLVDKVVEQIQAQVDTPRAQRKPFFIAAGLHKPHLPFYAPPAYFEPYVNASSPLPPPVPEGVAEGMPYVAWHSCLATQNTSNNSNWGSFVDIPNRMTFDQPMDAESRDRLRRGYYASVSFTDANVGRILEVLEPIRNETIVVFMGDHGWSLGEGNLWCKMTTEENGVRVPLLIRDPGSAAKRVTAPVEAVALYKSLADLSGLGAGRVEASVQGTSFAGLVRPGAPLSAPTYAKSQFPRCYTWIPKSHTPLPQYDRTDCQDTPANEFDFMGYSIRTAEYRYTEWRRWDKARVEADWSGDPVAVELYDHRNDSSAESPFGTETRNVASDPARAQELSDLAATARAAFAPGRLTM